MRARESSATGRRRARRARLVIGLAALGIVVGVGRPAAAQETDPPTDDAPLVELEQPAPVEEPAPSPDGEGQPLTEPQAPAVDGPEAPAGEDEASTEDSAISIIVVLTALALVPTVLIMATSFTRIVIVLGLTRNALGLQGVPPNQVLIGLAVFLTLFVMGPTLQEANDAALQPYLDGQLEFAEAYDLGVEPFRDFMLEQVRQEDLDMFLDLSSGERPATPEEIPLTTAGTGVSHLGAESSVHHRLHHLHPVPGGRHDRLGDPDGDGHDDAASGDDLTPVQDPALRNGRRLVPAGPDPDRVLPSVMPPPSDEAWARSVLGVGPLAGRSEVQHAFRDLSKRLHPDVGGHADAFETLLRAYEVLRSIGPEPAVDWVTGDEMASSSRFAWDVRPRPRPRRFRQVFADALREQRG